MTVEEIHVHDIGTVFELTIKEGNDIVDVSSATTKEILFRKPDNTKMTKSAEFVTDGTDGKIKHTTVENDLDMGGEWWMQARIVMNGNEWYSSLQNFIVHDNI